MAVCKRFLKTHGKSIILFLFHNFYVWIFTRIQIILKFIKRNVVSMDYFMSDFSSYLSQQSSVCHFTKTCNQLKILN